MPYTPKPEPHHESAWENPEYKLDNSDLYGSGADYRIGFLPAESTTVFGERGKTPCMYMKGDQLANIGKSLLGGNSIRHTAKLIGASKNTVKKFFHIFSAILQTSGKGELLCKCGKPIIDHKGWCVYRYKKSPKRQAFMKRWHSDTTDTTKILLLLEKLERERQDIVNKIHEINIVIKYLNYELKVDKRLKEIL